MLESTHHCPRGGHVPKDRPDLCLPQTSALAQTVPSALIPAVHQDQTLTTGWQPGHPYILTSFATCGAIGSILLEVPAGPLWPGLTTQLAHRDL